MYAKIYASMFKGTLYGKPGPLLVWCYMLANKDKGGFVDEHPEVIAGATGLELEEVRKAIAFLEAPDPDSRTPDLEGCRLERIDDHRDWGWRIVNSQKYKEMRDSEDRLRQNREAQARVRDRKAASANSQPHVSHSQPRSAHTKAEAKAEKEEDLVTETWLKGFDDHIWPAWPKKRKRQQALKSWMRLKPQDDEHGKMICHAIYAFVEQYIAENPADTGFRFLPDLSTWLNQGRWIEAAEGMS